MPCRILYFRGGILEETEDFASEDLFEAARVASGKRPHLTAEIWHDGQKAAVIRPCSLHSNNTLPPHIRRSVDEIELRHPISTGTGPCKVGSKGTNYRDEIPAAGPRPNSWTK